ncbi:MAG TPA: Nif3-like dinuclear metal center hexameric protein [Acidobacteriaceae bacterium]|nr:Nif3-like dinuclear metal center hexameric protein [Acidobacteriaceae bacterium]
MNSISRRDFVATGGAALSTLALGQSLPSSKLTAGEVVQRIQKQVAIPWREKTVDHLLTGDESTPVIGIATTMMATLDVVERAAAAKKNMIITHETPFYLHQDNTEDIQGDPTLLAKLDFCKKHDVALFHFHDHWHARQPDGIAEGMVKQLGWEKNVVDPANPRKLTFDGVSLAHLSQEIQHKLKARTIRVLGDPALSVHNVRTSWGFVSREPGIKIVSERDVDVLICGETREWELVEYVQDSITAGNRKGLILVGHVLSEQGGMLLCANWLKTFISEVPIQFIPATEPFWNPSHPVKL